LPGKIDVKLFAQLGFNRETSVSAKRSAEEMCDRYDGQDLGELPDELR
jgi:hypothetical protein